MVALPHLGPNATFPQSSANDVSAAGRFIVGESTASDGRITAARLSPTAAWLPSPAHRREPSSPSRQRCPTTGR